MIYFIESEGFIKVGFSADVAKRLHQIKGCTPHPVKLLGVTHGDRSDERRWHEQFAHLHHHLEWFRAEQDLRDAVSAVIEPLKRETKPVLIGGVEMPRGTISKLATFLDITPGAIAQWDKVPAERMGHIAQFTGIPMEVLRGDIFERASTPLPTIGEPERAA